MDPVPLLPLGLLPRFDQKLLLLDYNSYVHNTMNYSGNAGIIMCVQRYSRNRGGILMAVITSLA